MHRSHHHLRRPIHTRSGALYVQAQTEIDNVLYDVFGRGWERVRVEKLSRAIDEMKRRAERSEDEQKPARLLALLLLQTPRAVRAQDAMDKRHGGYRHRHKRLFELIDFNDTFVDMVLALNPYQRSLLAQLPEAMRQFCRRARTHAFSLEQLDAITYGLSREIAVYLGARQHGFDVHMSSRVADGMGVDMQIRWPESGRYVNIDCKTTNSYLHRIEDLRREGRLDEHEVGIALTRGYVRVINGRRDDAVRVVLFSVVPEVFGEVINYEFTHTDALAAKLHEVIRMYGEKGEGFYRYAENVDIL